MATGVLSPGRARIEKKTLRRDRWWLPPLNMAVVLAFFVVYATVRIFMNKYYWAPDEHYLTPVYSPCISAACVPGSSHFGQPLPAPPPFVPIAFITFVILAGFRATCYYYRKAYYRSFFLSPAACAVPEPHKKYSGETRFPLILQNYHRYFFYGAVVFALINLYDAILALHGKNGGVGVGLGTIIIWINVLMLWGYTFSCHACRHVFGGRLRNFSKHPVRYRLWTLISKLNVRHGQFAMISLFTVIFTDAYIMAVSAGWISDPRLFN
ncbi:hypothetical protein [Thermasporomyces composti]|jgi:hypothetical protein|uniref:Uncharacterized protein n=1 Tax=Thermasporomyces composti TaxID=696763 RepID=A0A3D9V5Z9_THECX|nr:hypothetical protein [Thermasporomyces composti]REF35590.1 hypothetical protein DFJ64_0972 [Thermasporomyces composti]